MPGVVALILGATAQAAAPEFLSDAGLTTDSGYVALEWRAEGPVELTIAENSGFIGAKPLYAGTERQLFLSGLADGSYFVRLKDETGARSAPLRITVAHQSLSRALWLTLAGAIVALGILITILRGARND